MDHNKIQRIYKIPQKRKILGIMLIFLLTSQIAPHEVIFNLQRFRVSLYITY